MKGLSCVAHISFGMDTYQRSLFCFFPFYKNKKQQQLNNKTVNKQNIYTIILLIKMLIY